MQPVNWDQVELRVDEKVSSKEDLLKAGFQVGDFIAKLKVIYNDEDTNRDILEYIGPVDFGVQIFRLLDNFFVDQAELILEVQPGGKFSTELHKGGYQISANFRIEGININPAFYLQYYHGYAETLLNYDQKVDVFRAGITF